MTEPSFEQSQASMRPHEDPVSLPKILLISSLALATLVPTFFVSELIAEREARQGVVQSEFTRNWGPPQELRSPTLVVPYQSAPDRPCGTSRSPRSSQRDCEPHAAGAQARLVSRNGV